MIGVKLEISRGAAKSGITIAQVGQLLAASIIGRLMPAVRDRVQKTGDLAGQQFPGWSSKGWIFTSPRYPDRAIGRHGPSGAERYRNATEYHHINQTLPGSYSTTGGMWSGLSVVVESPTRAAVLFRGRSEGRDPNFFRSKAKNAETRKGRKSRVQVRARGIMVNNALKAWTVLRQHGVNVLALSDAEMRKVAESATLGLAVGASVSLPIEWNVPVPSTLAEAMSQVWS